MLQQILYLLGTAPTIGGIAVLVALAPEPRSLMDHLKGLARYLMVFGAGLSAARVLMGWTPPWEVVALMLGMGLAIGIHAREGNLVANAQEKLEQTARDAGA